MKRPPERITRLKGAEGASAAFGAAGSDAPKKAKAAEGLDPMDAELFERLRALRKRIATEATVPPYVVFSDAALRAMCLARRTKPNSWMFRALGRKSSSGTAKSSCAKSTPSEGVC